MIRLIRHPSKIIRLRVSLLRKRSICSPRSPICSSFCRRLNQNNGEVILLLFLLSCCCPNGETDIQILFYYILQNSVSLNFSFYVLLLGVLFLFPTSKCVFLHQPLLWPCCYLLLSCFLLIVIAHYYTFSVSFLGTFTYLQFTAFYLEIYCSEFIMFLK